MMGARGLRAKMEDGIKDKEMGSWRFCEVRRQFTSAVLCEPALQKMLLREEAEKIALANLCDKGKLKEVPDITDGKWDFGEL